MENIMTNEGMILVGQLLACVAGLLLMGTGFSAQPQDGWEMAYGILVIGSVCAGLILAHVSWRSLPLREQKDGLLQAALIAGMFCVLYTAALSTFIGQMHCVLFVGVTAVICGIYMFQINRNMQKSRY